MKLCICKVTTDQAAVTKGDPIQREFVKLTKIQFAIREVKAHNGLINHGKIDLPHGARSEVTVSYTRKMNSGSVKVTVFKMTIGKYGACIVAGRKVTVAEIAVFKFFPHDVGSAKHHLVVVLIKYKFCPHGAKVTKGTSCAIVLDF